MATAPMTVSQQAARPRKTNCRAPKNVKRKADYLEFLKFSGVPRSLRDKQYGYIDDVSFAKAHQLDPSTLCVWKAGPGFWDEVKDIIHFWGKDKTPDVIGALYQVIIKNPAAPEIKLWLQYFEDFKEKSESELTATRATLFALQESNRKLFEQERRKK